MVVLGGDSAAFGLDSNKLGLYEASFLHFVRKPCLEVLYVVEQLGNSLVRVGRELVEIFAVGLCVRVDFLTEATDFAVLFIYNGGVCCVYAAVPAGWAAFHFLGS